VRSAASQLTEIAMPNTPEPENIPEVIPITDESNDPGVPPKVAAHSPDSAALSSPTGRIAFKDFVPKQEGTRPALLGLVQAPVFAELEEAVSRANRWIGRAGVRILNVETVLLPNVAETNQSAVVTNRDMQDSWRQFIRVWYVESL
jgi:hypothetical protein